MARMETTVSNERGLGGPVGAPEAAALEMNAPVNILLVDDRPENLRALELIFEDSNYNLVAAQSGSQALKQLLMEDFAVVLLDVQMPGLDGFETASLIRKRQKSRHTPIIFITAINKEDRYVFRGYSLGAVDYIFKPVEPEILRSKVAVFVELFRKNQQVKLQAELLRQSELRERERKISELTQRSERHYRSLADNVPQIVWSAPLDGTPDFFNARWYEYAGFRPEQTSGRSIQDIMHPDDLPRAREIGIHTNGAVARSYEARLRRWDGEYRWHLVHIVPETDRENGLSWLGTATDIDDAKRIAQALAIEKEQLATTLRSIGDGVVTTDIDGKIVLMNRVAEELTGCKFEHVRGKPLTEVLVFEQNDSPHAQELMSRVFTSRTAMELPKEVYLLAKSGRQHIVSVNAAPLMAPGSDDVVGVVLAVRDATDRHRLEEERLKASKLESVGLLAGAIAHDFNNILTAIMGNISLAKLYTQSGDKIFDRLTEAEKASVWAKDLTQQLLTFAKGGAPVKKTAMVADLVRDAASFATRGSHARCEFDFAAGCAPVEVDEGQMRQVIHNLVLNAQQAMPQGGRIKLSTCMTTVKPDTLPLPPGEYVNIRCEDEGVGIAPENLPKIFDPYFTTKQRGSGLGLATSYSIIKKHDGLIVATSEVGRGTCFNIYLPPSNQPVPAALNEAPQAEAGGSARVLVMDDEAFIRDLLRRLFSFFNYEVDFAEDGEQALEAYKKALADNRRYDVVIMDLVIPGGMGGRETIQHLLKLDPNACAVVSSGYSNDPIMADYRKYGFAGAVAKPYKNEELRSVVQKLVKRPAA